MLCCMGFYIYLDIQLVALISSSHTSKLSDNVFCYIFQVMCNIHPRIQAFMYSDSGGVVNFLVDSVPCFFGKNARYILLIIYKSAGKRQIILRSRIKPYNSGRQYGILYMACLLI